MTVKATSGILRALDLTATVEGYEEKIVAARCPDTPKPPGWDD